MMEEEGTPTFMGLSADECHALAYGVKDGFKFWNRTHILYSQIDELDTSDEVKRALKLKWHYYEIGSDLPEDVALLALLIWVTVTGQTEGGARIVLSLLGITI